jgi:hypothetical protein
VPLWLAFLEACYSVRISAADFPDLATSSLPHCPERIAITINFLMHSGNYQGQIKGFVGPWHFSSLGPFGDSKSIDGTTVYSRLSGLMEGESHMDPIYTPPANLPKIHSDPILPSKPWSSKWSLSF